MAILSVAALMGILLFSNTYCFTKEDRANASSEYCPYFRNYPSLNVLDLVGSWLTVYSQPKAIDCFTLHVRATTDLEREQCTIKYGNFSGLVNWEDCLLEVESPLGKHYLQGTGSNAGLLDNIIIAQKPNGSLYLQEESSDQWMIYGRRGSEVVVLRDCLGETAAAFARAPYWPTADELYAILHRSGIAPLTQGKVLCEPRNIPQTQVSISRYFGNM